MKALNTLAMRSTEIDHRSLIIENYPHLIIALGELMDVVNPLAAEYFSARTASGSQVATTIEWSYKSDVNTAEVSIIICLENVMVTCVL